MAKSFDQNPFFFGLLKIFGVNFCKLAKKSGQMAIFLNGFGHKKSSIYAGLRAFWSKTHFFF